MQSPDKVCRFVSNIATSSTGSLVRKLTLGGGNRRWPSLPSPCVTFHRHQLESGRTSSVARIVVVKSFSGSDYFPLGWFSARMTRAALSNTLLLALLDMKGELCPIIFFESKD
jgi:hypothetical protein